MRPGGFGSRRRIDSAVTLLPLPDSPTMPSTSPGASVEADAVDGDLSRPGGPNTTRRFSTESSVSAMLHLEPRIEHVAQAVAEQVQAEQVIATSNPGNSAIQSPRACSPGPRR